VNQAKEYSLALNGGLDTRSADGACGQGFFRMLLNVSGAEVFQMCSLGGWQRRGYTNACQNNSDLHDQQVESQVYSLPYDYTVDAYSVQIGTAYYQIPIYQSFPETTTELCDGTYYLGRTCREAVTFLKSVTSVTGSRRLLAGTHSRLYASDDAGGNWRIIADGLGGDCSPSNLCGCSSIRLQSATLGNFTILTNGVDEVLQWQFDTGPAGCYVWSADYVQELRELNVTRAAGVIESGGIVTLFDVRMDNQDFPNRMLWSDYNAPTSWIPGGESIAGFQDLALGEKIIAIIPIGGRDRVYTNQAIYNRQLVADERTYVFTEIYRLKGGVTSNLPAFRNGIANCGDFHVWVSQDDIYMMADYDTKPQLSDWMHRAGGVIFNGIRSQWVKGTEIPARSGVNRRACDQLIARWSGREKCVIISWPTGSNVCPDLSLFLWPDTTKASVVDYGFTEAVEHQPDTALSWRDYFGLIGLCDPAEYLLEKEGASCPTAFVPVEYVGLWNATEDTTLPMDPNSVAAVFCDVCMTDLCKQCDADTTLVLASASDKTLKEFTPDQFVREELTDQVNAAFPEASLGVYELRPYSVLLQTDASQPEGPAERTFRAGLVGYSVDDSTSPPILYMHSGGGWTPGCLEWEIADGVAMECGANTPTTRGGQPAKYSFMTSGAWLAFRLVTEANAFCLINIAYRIEGSRCW
jgi:hypothetical protein